MSHTVSSKSRADREGGYSFECFAWGGELFRAQGGFATQREAIAAAEQAEREMTLAAMAGNSPTLDGVFAEMSDDELLAELGA